MSKGKWTAEEQEDILSRIKTTTDIKDAVEEADMVIEAMVENMEVKTNLFRQLDQYSPKHAILASNTSSLPITEIAAATSRQELVIGMHFMHPVPVMKLVEDDPGLSDYGRSESERR